jgi:excisionase family DNA binding protein
MEKEKIHTVQEVADLLRIDNRTVQRRCTAGKFPGAYKTGEASNSHWRIPQSGLEAYLKKIGRL